MNSQERYCEAEGNCPASSLRRGYWIAGAWMAAGAAFGATAMYLCDPNRGKARRTRLQERAIHTARRTGQELAGKAEDLLNRTKGAVAEARARLACAQEADDVVVADRVRSHLGHVTGHAGDIETEVTNGVVALHGAVPGVDKQRVVDEVLRIPGVKGVRDLLVPASPV
jgi:osmotically-inducible protein OsmY